MIHNSNMQLSKKLLKFTIEYYQQIELLIHKLINRNIKFNKSFQLNNQYHQNKIRVDGKTIYNNCKTNQQQPYKLIKSNKKDKIYQKNCNKQNNKIIFNYKNSTIFVGRNLKYFRENNFLIDYQNNLQQYIEIKAEVNKEIKNQKMDIPRKNDPQISIMNKKTSPNTNFQTPTFIKSGQITPQNDKVQRQQRLTLKLKQSTTNNIKIINPQKPYQIYMNFLEIQKIVKKRIADYCNIFNYDQKIEKQLPYYIQFIQSIAQLSNQLKQWAFTKNTNTNDKFQILQYNQAEYDNAVINNIKGITRPSSTNVSCAISKNLKARQSAATFNQNEKQINQRCSTAKPRSCLQSSNVKRKKSMKIPIRVPSANLERQQLSNINRINRKNTIKRTIRYNEDSQKIYNQFEDLVTNMKRTEQKQVQKVVDYKYRNLKKVRPSAVGKSLFVKLKLNPNQSQISLHGNLSKSERSFGRKDSKMSRNSSRISQNSSKNRASQISRRKQKKLSLLIESQFRKYSRRSTYRQKSNFQEKDKSNINNSQQKSIFLRNSQENKLNNKINGENVIPSINPQLILDNPLSLNSSYNPQSPIQYPKRNQRRMGFLRTKKKNNRLYQKNSQHKSIKEGKGKNVQDNGLLTSRNGLIMPKNNSQLDNRFPDFPQYGNIGQIIDDGLINLDQLNSQNNISNQKINQDHDPIISHNPLSYMSIPPTHPYLYLRGLRDHLTTLQSRSYQILPAYFIRQELQEKLAHHQNLEKLKNPEKNKKNIQGITIELHSTQSYVQLEKIKAGERTEYFRGDREWIQNKLQFQRNILGQKSYPDLVSIQL